MIPAGIPGPGHWYGSKSHGTPPMFWGVSCRRAIGQGASAGSGLLWLAASSGGTVVDLDH